MVLSRAVGIARSRIYRCISGTNNKRAVKSQALDQEIRRVYLERKKLYGAPKIWAELIRKGWDISLKRVQRHMRTMGLRSIIRKRYRSCIAKKHPDNVGPVPNILNQNFHTQGINQVWCTDITYVYTRQDGWTYLACVLELYSRKVIGWAYSRLMDTALVLQALKRACQTTDITQGIILRPMKPIYQHGV